MSAARAVTEGNAEQPLGRSAAAASALRSVLLRDQVHRAELQGADGGRRCPGRRSELTTTIGRGDSDMM